MTARIAGFVTRAAAGLRGPKSVSTNITPNKGGVAIHYGGPTQPAANDGSDHAKCVTTWRNWQKFHMDTRGWSDIAYTGGFCNHGYAFAGRGAGVRTAANGTNSGNQNNYAVTWIGGEGQTPSQAALDAADWWIASLRQNGSAGRAVKPHRFFKATGCPGVPLVEYAASRDGKDIAQAVAKDEAPEPKPAAPTRYYGNCQKLQRAVRVEADNNWGPGTEKACEAVRQASWKQFPFGVAFVQRVVGATPDGAWGGASRRALGITIQAMQEALSSMAHTDLARNGAWDTPTEEAYQKVRKICKRF